LLDCGLVEPDAAILHPVALGVAAAHRAALVPLFRRMPARPDSHHRHPPPEMGVGFLPSDNATPTGMVMLLPARMAAVAPTWPMAAGVRHNDRVTVHPVVESKRAEIAALCRELGVRRLDIFGSAVTEHFDTDRSDVDVLVEVEQEQLTMANYFALRNGLQRILGRDVDVLDIGSLRNPYVRSEVMATREVLYAA
jgi:uncharacterized protein